MEKDLVILSPEGLHARPAAIFSKRATEFVSTIEIVANGQKKNAKSIMSVLSLGLEKGAPVTLIAHGEDAERAIEVLGNLLEKGV